MTGYIRVIFSLRVTSFFLSSVAQKVVKSHFFKIGTKKVSEKRRHFNRALFWLGQGKCVVPTEKFWKTKKKKIPRRRGRNLWFQVSFAVPVIKLGFGQLPCELWKGSPEMSLWKNRPKYSPTEILPILMHNLNCAKSNPKSARFFWN
jgi:hypothetical protein